MVRLGLFATESRFMVDIGSYIGQRKIWPSRGKHILAQYDAETIIVYQAYNHSLGNFAVQNGYFGGDFHYTRMSWIKPNFLWMMYRSGWGVKPNQEVTLAIRLSRTFFDKILDLAVPSSFHPENYQNQEEWQEAIKHSQVRLQWDPDHLPTGAPLDRKAIQLGLRGSILEEYGRKAILEITDLSAFVNEQREYAKSKSHQNLQCPIERIYIPSNPKTRLKLGLDSEPT